MYQCKACSGALTPAVTKVFLRRLVGYPAQAALTVGKYPSLIKADGEADKEILVDVVKYYVCVCRW